MVESKNRSVRFFPTASILSAVCALLFLFCYQAVCFGSEILVRLSGDIEYPGMMSLRHEEFEIELICFLGDKVPGKVDMRFLRLLSEKAVPEGNYQVSAALPEEKWPTLSFRKNGALRLKPVSQKTAAQLAVMGLHGVAIHGRDFYPLLDTFSKRKMIDYYNDRLFDALRTHWGPLRISNWDMGRLHDFWKRFTESPKQWKARLVAADKEDIRKKCKPPVTKRKPD